MIDTAKLLDDVEFAKAMLENELSNTDIVFALRNLLKMKYYPVAYFGSHNLQKFVGKLVTHIAHLGVESSFGSEAQEIVPSGEFKTVVYKQGIEIKEVMGSNIILAVGKEGSSGHRQKQHGEGGISAGDHRFSREGGSFGDSLRRNHTESRGRAG